MNTTPAPSAALSKKTVITIGPREGAASHLVILLHGVRADAASFQQIGRALANHLPHAEFVVPDGFSPFDGGGSGRQWFSVRGVTEENRSERVRAAGHDVSRWIDEELARRGLGGDRLVLVGFSQGAIVSAWLALHRSPRPAAVVMLSGRVAPDAEASTGAESVPVFWGHGEGDPVIAASLVEPGARLLESWGARVTRRVYPGLAHQVDARELREVGAFLETSLATP